MEKSITTFTPQIFTECLLCARHQEYNGMKHYSMSLLPWSESCMGKGKPTPSKGQRQ